MSHLARPLKRYRIAQVTDLHFTLLPTLRDLFPLQLNYKRLIGLLSLTAGRRLWRFDLRVQQQCVQKVIDLKPDVCLISGDISSTALHREYQLAQRTLQSLLDNRQHGIETFMTPGNHDLYTVGAEREKTMWQYFGRWMTSRKVKSAATTPQPPTAAAAADALPTLTYDDHLEIVALDPNRPMFLQSSGCYPQSQLQALQQKLTTGNSGNKFTLLATHYPLLDADNKDYGRKHPSHGVVNGYELIDLLQQAPHKPHLCVHGHVHRGYPSQLLLDHRSPLHPPKPTPLPNAPHQHSMPIYNPGSAGQKHNADKKRSGAFNLYTISQADQMPTPTTPAPHNCHSHNVNGWNIEVERYLHDGEDFVLEKQPYSSGY